MEYRTDYGAYREILADIKDTGKAATFREALGRDEFLILRHDVEFSLEKAARMAEIDAELGVQSVFFVQLESNAYNALSAVSVDLMAHILSLGHEIGLHYRQKHGLNAEVEIKNQAELLSSYIGRRVQTFSCHMPRGYYDQISVGGMINAYDPRFFTRTDDLSEVEVKYISDSNMRWNYGEPTAREFNTYSKVQLLIHPFGWGDINRDPDLAIERLHRERWSADEAMYKRELNVLRNTNL